MMTVCDRIEVDAAGLAALDPSDADRVAAFAHARTCPRCARALGEGVALVGLLQAAAPLPAPRPEALMRAAAEIRAALAADAHPSGRWRAVVGIVFAVLAAWIVPLVGGRRLSGHPDAWASMLVAGLAAVVTAAALTMSSRLVLLLPLGSLLISGWRGVEGPWALVPGLPCLAFELAMAMVPVGVAFWLARRGAFRRLAPVMAAAAAGGALAGQAVLEVTCHALRTHAHLLVFHSGAVVIALAVGWLLGSRLAPVPHAGGR